MKTGSVKQGNFSYVRSSVAQLSLPFVALIVMSAVFACINPNFLAVENTASLLRHIAPMLIIGIGQSYVLISGGIDLSIGSVVCLSNLFTVNLAREFHSISPALSCIIALFCGCLIGLLNGILIAKAKFPPALSSRRLLLHWALGL